MASRSRSGGNSGPAGVKVAREGQCGMATSLPPERAMTIATTTARTRMDATVDPTKNGMKEVILDINP